LIMVVMMMMMMLTMQQQWKCRNLFALAVLPLTQSENSPLLLFIE